MEDLFTFAVKIHSMFVQQRFWQTTSSGARSGVLQMLFLRQADLMEVPTLSFWSTLTGFCHEGTLGHVLAWEAKKCEIICSSSNRPSVICCSCSE